MNSVFPNLTPQAVSQTFLTTKYSRQERRHHAFVFQNNTNGLFVRRIVEGGKVIFDDVELKEATGFKFISLKSVASQIPHLDISVKMAYRNKNRELCVK